MKSKVYLQPMLDFTVLSAEDILMSSPCSEIDTDPMFGDSDEE